MKKTLLLLLAFVPLLCQSQEFRFALHAGLNPKSNVPIVSKGLTWAFGARTLVGFKSIEAGLAYESGKYSGRGFITGQQGAGKLYTHANYYTLSLIGNYKFNLTPGIQLYSGAVAGLDIGEDVDRYVYTGSMFGSGSVNKRLHGFLVGAQLGGRYHFSETFAAHAEVAARAPIYMTNFRYIALYFPMTIGVSARLFGDASPKAKTSE